MIRRPCPCPRRPDTSIVKQVASIIVYEDQEEAVAMASEFDDIHDELAMDAVSSRASLSRQAQREPRCHSQDRRERAWRDTEGSDDSIDVEAVDRDRAPRDHLPRRR